MFTQACTCILIRRLNTGFQTPKYIIGYEVIKNHIFLEYENLHTIIIRYLEFINIAYLIAYFLNVYKLKNLTQL